uniref:Site-specific recombinase-like protein, phage integrase family n=3 Tax=Pseudomonas TaxID=286 RepID=A0A7G8A9A3_PSEAI|nr:Hypothetical protein [Pseudomonas putida]QNI15574.1 Site-specific recombinase-like protein, phage integrase family [Pseudomonas aeruginosa]QNI16524.1 Site-specific recombinase-like protein, phage integrase family [Pseudomonas aeruginosa]QNI17017.1 Site-specific recombinase-like protein, phage integrase family [Pseudomonas sp.]
MGALMLFREHLAGPADMLIRRPASHSLRIDLDPQPILTESPAWPPAELHPFALVNSVI